MESQGAATRGGIMADFPAVIDLDALDGTDGFQLNGIDPYDYSGFSVASAGDVNGDGFDDLIVGAFMANALTGQTYVVFGGDGGFPASLDFASLDGSNGFRLDGANDFDFSGFSVASAGDVNDDGFDDIIIGAWRAGAGGEMYAGASYVVFGHDEPFVPVVDLGGLDGADGFRLDGIAAGDYSGFSVASAGDVNGDGFDDVIVGAFRASPDGNTYAGETYVVFGQGAPFADTIDLASLDGTDGFRLTGIAPYDYSGFSVASAGDVNGDGFADLIIGAYGAAGAEPYAGESYIVFGHASGFAPVVDLGDLDGTNGFRLNGAFGGDYSGYSVASAGDIDGDGYDDLIVGAWQAGGDAFAGETYVVFGRALRAHSQLDLGSLNGANGFRIDGANMSDYSGFSVASAGDVNGDGFDDILIGAPGCGCGTGSGYVIFGQRGPFAPSFSLSGLDGENGFILDGIEVGNRTGNSVASAGDVNGDGFADVIIGAPGASGGSGGYAAGETYVIFGRAPTTGVTRTGSAADQTMLGGAFADTLIGGRGADRLEGGQGDDQLRGGLDDDVLLGGDGNDGLAGGQGADTLAGGAGDDRLAGGNGDDIIDGGDGADFIIGGMGQDMLTGGGGADQFQFRATDAGPTRALADLIADFSQADGDHIRLRLIDADVNAAGRQSFAWIGDGEFSGTAGELRYAQDGGTTFVEGDTDGDGSSDFAIALTGTVTLVEGDFIL
jgi:hypothetical protein